MIIVIFTLILISLLYKISKEDIKTLLISENNLSTLAITGFVYLMYSGITNRNGDTLNLIIRNSLSSIIIFFIMYLISQIGYKVFGTNSLGIGDIKLSSISTIWLGIELSLMSLCFSFILSAIYCIHGKLFKKFKPFQQYAFAPFISIGILCSWIIDKI